MRAGRLAYWQGEGEPDYDYDFPVVNDESLNLDELSTLFEPGFEDIPFTPAEEEMLQGDREPVSIREAINEMYKGFIEEGFVDRIPESVKKSYLLDQYCAYKLEVIKARAEIVFPKHGWKNFKPTLASDFENIDRCYVKILKNEAPWTLPDVVEPEVQKEWYCDTQECRVNTFFATEGVSGHSKEYCPGCTSPSDSEKTLNV